MLLRRALRKIFITTLTAFILITFYTISNINNKEKVLKTNLEIEYITGIGTNNIYLLDKNNYLVKTKIIIESKEKKEQIKIILNNLNKRNNSKYPKDLSGTINEDIRVLSINYDEGYVTIDFNNKFNKSKNKEKMVESIVYSIMDLKDVKGVIITVNGNMLEGYNKVLDKNIGINKKYDIKKRDNIQKIVIYYLEDINDTRYYVPVTRYLNDDRDKIKIIVEELASSYIYEPNLMSFLNSNTKLIDYKEQENVMSLNFNTAIFDKNNKVVEEVKYTLAYSIFDNYDVNEVLINVSGKKKTVVSRKDLE